MKKRTHDSYCLSTCFDQPKPSNLRWSELHRTFLHYLSVKGQMMRIIVSFEFSMRFWNIVHHSSNSNKRFTLPWLSFLHCIANDSMIKTGQDIIVQWSMQVRISLSVQSQTVYLQPLLYVHIHNVYILRRFLCYTYNDYTNWNWSFLPP